MTAEDNKTFAIEQCKNALINVLFSTVYTMSNTLFDIQTNQDKDTQEVESLEEQLKKKEESLAKKVESLKTIKLSEVEYSFDGSSEFTIKRKNSTEAGIRLSNRDSLNGEIRGEKLRNLIEAEQDKNQTLFDFIEKISKDPKYSDSITYAKNPIVTLYNSMTDTQFDLYISALWSRLNNAVKQNQLDIHTPLPETFGKPDAEVDAINNRRAEFWTGIDAVEVFDAIAKFDAVQPKLDAMNAKASQLKKACYPEASKAARALTSSISSAMDDYIMNNKTLEEFEKTCLDAFNTAENSELKNTRGFFAKIMDVIRSILHIQKPPTDSIKKTQDFKTALLGVKDEAAMPELQTNKAADEDGQENRPPSPR